MPYYIRVLAEDAAEVPISDLRGVLEEQGSSAVIAAEGEPEGQWSQLVLKHQESGEAIAAIERNLVLPGELGAEEIAEFIDEVQLASPRSAAEWLGKQLARVKVIYAFQVLQGTDVDNGWDPLHAIVSHLRGRCNGIVQADGEGFSNMDGSHILWQFSDGVKGKWEMAVLDPAGQWQRFEMELGDRKQRAAFLQGRVPPGVQVL